MMFRAMGLLKRKTPEEKVAAKAEDTESIP
jgi:hypothetical protein